MDIIPQKTYKALYTSNEARTKEISSASSHFDLPLFSYGLGPILDNRYLDVIPNDLISWSGPSLTTMLHETAMENPLPSSARVCTSRVRPRGISRTSNTYESFSLEVCTALQPNLKLTSLDC